MAAVAFVWLNGKNAFALRAGDLVAFDRYGLAVHFEIRSGGDNLAAMSGFVAEADDAAAVAVFHKFPLAKYMGYFSAQC